MQNKTTKIGDFKMESFFVCKGLRFNAPHSSSHFSSSVAVFFIIPKICCSVNSHTENVLNSDRESISVSGLLVQII